ncbi:MAG: hypothetical protein QXN49_03895 [Archaeoglobaceae archaeon]|nr:hypothetical protein [Archaeoglobales archaeon]
MEDLCNKERSELAKRIKQELRYLIDREDIPWEKFAEMVKTLLDEPLRSELARGKFSKEEKERIKRELRGLIDPPEGWEIDVEITPYLLYDMGYEIDKERKIIRIQIYSARYPESYYGSYRELADKVKEIFNGIFIDLDKLNKQQILAISKIALIIENEWRQTIVILRGEKLLIVYPSKILLEYLERNGIEYEKPID